MLPGDYQRFPSFWPDAQLRKWNMWGYIDARDAASACRLALDAPVEGAEVAIIAAADTVMDRPSADLLAEVYPTVTLSREVSGFETLLAIDRARSLLGWAPRYSWRNQLPA
jgi:nucleoside-diphosphate-sugar epimerase